MDDGFRGSSWNQGGNYRGSWPSRHHDREFPQEGGYRGFQGGDFGRRDEGFGRRDFDRGFDRGNRDFDRRHPAFDREDRGFYPPPPVTHEYHDGFRGQHEHWEKQRWERSKPRPLFPEGDPRFEKPKPKRRKNKRPSPQETRGPPDETRDFSQRQDAGPAKRFAHDRPSPSQPVEQPPATVFSAKVVSKESPSTSTSSPKLLQSSTTSTSSPKVLYNPSTSTSSPKLLQNIQEERNVSIPSESNLLHVSPSIESMSPVSHVSDEQANLSKGSSQPKANPPPPSTCHYCRLCNSQKPFNTDYDFDIHLTFIHYKERIMKRVKPPYQCQKCHYVPARMMSEEEQKEDLLLHYGSAEKVSANFYQQDVAKMPQPEERPVVIQEPVTVTCKICHSSHDSERHFLRHITLRHFTKHLIEDLPKKAPYLCPFIDCSHEKQTLHHLMIHYGCEHNISMELYWNWKPIEDVLVISDPDPGDKSSPVDPRPVLPKKKSTDSRPIPPKSKSSLADPRPVVPTPKVPETKAPRPELPPVALPVQRAPDDKAKGTSKLRCSMCKGKKSFVTQKSLNYHLMLTHFFPDLPPIGPFPCPRCNSEFEEKNDFAKHFLDSHFDDYTMDGQLELRSDAGQPTSEFTEKPVGSNTKNQNESPRESLSLPRATPQAIVTPFIRRPEEKKITPNRPEIEPVRRRRISIASDEDRPSDDLSGVRTMKTTHRSKGPRAARQRMQAKWESSSLESQKQKIEELQETISSMKEEHKEALNRKVKEFERWITQKEKQLEDQDEKRKALEDRLEQANVDNVDLRKQLEQKQSSFKSMEDLLVERHNLNHQVMKEKKQLDKQLKQSNNQVKEKNEELEKMDEKVKELEQTLLEKGMEITSLNVNISVKEDELADTKSAHQLELDDLQRENKRLEKQVTFQKNKAEKITEEKKVKIEQIRDLNKKVKETESENKTLIKQNKTLESKMTQQRHELDKTLKSESKQEKNMSRQMEEVERKLKDSVANCDNLEAQRSGLLDTLEKIQKTMSGYEALLKDKNEKLRDQTSKMEEAEMNLSDALEKLKEMKSTDREKRELQRQIRQLQGTLQDWENRQFTNIKLIDGLQKKNSELEKKVKDFEENNTGVEEEMYNLSSTIRQKEKDIKTLKNTLEEVEQNQAKAEARLEAKCAEISALKSEKIELEQSVRELEKEIRSVGASAAPKIEPVELENRKEELRHLKLTLTNMKADNIRLKEEFKKAELRTDKIETEYSKALTTIETLKNGLKLNSKTLVAKTKEISSLKVLLKSCGVPAPTKECESTQEDVSEPPQVSDLPVNVKEEQLDISENTADHLHIKEEQADDCANELGDTSTTLSIPDDELKEPVKISKVEVDASSSQLIWNPSEVIDAQSTSMGSFNYDDIAVSEESDEDDDDLSRLFSSSVNPPESSTSSYEQSPSQSSTHAKQTQVYTPVFPLEKKKKSKSKGLEDVTGQEDENGEVVCGICDQYDPPVQDDNLGDVYTTEWVGCDCDRWFHKPCTKLKRFSKFFSCRSVKMKCLKGKGSKAKAKNTSLTDSSSNFMDS